MIRQYKSSSLLNIAGLTVAFASFYVIMAQVWWTLGYNKSIKDADRIYGVEIPFSGHGEWTDCISRPIGESCLKKIPEVESFGCYWSSGVGNIWREDLSKTDYYKFHGGGAMVSMGFFEVFSFETVDGDIEQLRRPRTMAVSESLVKAQGLKIGERLYLTNEKPSPEDGYEIVAVFRDFKENTYLSRIDYYVNMGDRSLEDRSEWSYRYFLKLSEGDECEEQTVCAFNRLVEEYFRKTESKEVSESLSQVHLAPFDTLLFDSYSNPMASRVTIYSMLGLALVVIALAFINFVNFFFALVPIRIRMVNTCKIFGASNLSLRLEFISEAVGLVVISVILAGVLAHLFQFTDMANNFSMSLSLGENMSIVVIVLVLVVGLVMSLVASLYPSWYITSFSPAMVTKGRFAGTKSGQRLRTVLLGVQFFVSIGLIIFTAFLFMQRQYLINHDLGLNTRNVLTFNMRTNDNFNYELLRERLMRHPDIKDVTGSQMLIFSKGGMDWGRETNGKEYLTRAYEVKYNFLDFMNIEIVEGRKPQESDVFKDAVTRENYDNLGGVLIINERFAKEYDFKPLRDLEGGGFYAKDRLIGICKDFCYLPLREESTHVTLYVTPKEHAEGRDAWGVQVYVRHGEQTDKQKLAADIRSIIHELDPSFIEGDIQIETFDEVIACTYQRETRMTKIFIILSLISIIIALMGVFGIVLFETQRCRHEIAVRKAIGATTREILELFNLHYVKMVIICFVLVVPFTIYGLNLWLESYAYRTPLHWWVFALAFLLVMGITLLTVTVRSWNAASENPIKSLKKE